MRILDVQQGSDEWKELRRSKVGASDIAALMVGTEKEIYQLYWEKMGQDKYQTAAMRRGSNMEDEARKWFESEMGIQFERPVGLHDKYDWLLASFDGLNFELGVSLEIKCPNQIVIPIEDSKQWSRYYWQIQAQLAVGGHERGILLAYSPDVQAKAFVYRDEESISKLLEKGKWFYDLMISNTSPPEPIVYRDDPEAVEFAEAAKLLKTQMDALEEQWKILREGGIYLAGDASFECNGVKVVKTAPRASVDYKAALDSVAPQIDLSAFVKHSKPSWRVTI